MNTKNKPNLIGISGKMGVGKDLVGEIIQYLNYRKDHSGNDTFKCFEFQGLTKQNKEQISLCQDFKIKKFANKLKHIICLLIGCDKEQLENREFKEKPLGQEWWVYKGRYGQLIPFLESNKMRSEEDLIKITPRILMQLLGTEAGRNIIHPDLWCLSLFADYKPKESIQNKEIIKYYPNWIITDVRFPNEAKAIKDRGGILIRVNSNYDEKFFIRWWDNINNADRIKVLSEVKNPSEGLPINEIVRWYFKLNNTNHESETSLDNYKDWDYVIENDSSISDLVKKVINLNII